MLCEQVPVLPSRITVSARHRPRPRCLPRHRPRLGDSEKVHLFFHYDRDLCPCVGGAFVNYSHVSLGIPGVHSCGFAQEVEKGSTEEYRLKSTFCEFGNKIENCNEKNTNYKRF